MTTSYFYKLTLSYCGARYYGWQVQQETTETIQGKLNTAFSKATNISSFKSIGGGRTDTGVHALGQVARIECSNDLPESVFLKGVNNHLPKDIRILSVEKVDKDFHPVFSAKKKEYFYVVSLNGASSFFHSLVTSENCDDEKLSLMEAGLKLFKGKHDFINYRCLGTEVKSTIREIYDVSLTRETTLAFGDFTLEGDFVILRVCGEGFLKQMVRLIVGTLFALGDGKVTLGDIEKSFDYPLENKLGKVAPPNGLYLDSISY